MQNLWPKVHQMSPGCCQQALDVLLVFVLFFIPDKLGVSISTASSESATYAVLSGIGDLVPTGFDWVGPWAVSCHRGVVAWSWVEGCYKYNVLLRFSFLKSWSFHFWSLGQSLLKSGMNFQGKLMFKETNYMGFEQMPQALMDLLDGKNTGKVVIKSWVTKSIIIKIDN